MKVNITGNGYATVELFKNTKGKRLLVHRLAAMTFIENVNNLPQINHIDENKLNNNIENLEWCTAKHNMNYGSRLEKQKANTDYSDLKRKEIARKNGKKVSKKVAQYNTKGIKLNVFNSIVDAQKYLGIKSSHIVECCKRTRKTSNGFIWEYERGNGLSACQY